MSYFDYVLKGEIVFYDTGVFQKYYYIWKLGIDMYPLVGIVLIG